jgi:hypothetical protein
MRVIFALIILSLTTSCFGQIKTTPQEIDRLLENISFANSYRYWYGNGEGSREEFLMDTVNGKLLKYTFTQEDVDTFKIEYLFVDSHLVKVSTAQLRNSKVKSIGTYYFADNKVFHRYGKNIDLKGKKTFGRISPKFFAGQLEHIYYQYEFLNPNKKRFEENVSVLLKAQRNKIDRRLS